jgi:uncharacterized membrane protein YfcA
MLDLIFGIGNVLIGLMMTLTGFKVIKNTKWKDEPEKEELWHKKFGLFFKIGGVILFVGGVFKIVNFF